MCMKQILKKVVGEQVLRNNELVTLLHEASAVLNSRPLAPIDAHSPDGVALLTPGHFLTGGPLVALPTEPDLPNQATYVKR